MGRAHAIPTSYGLDLSVDAVKLAAMTLKQSLILRADLLAGLPFGDGSLDLVQSIFAPRPLAEIKRVLRPDGYALFVYPEAGHDSWTETYNNPELYEWCLRHTRKIVVREK